ncbi:MAG: hypothetical protein A2651_01480 [Candidatus Yanofskybacteria bacterium RIFCSPHIGHO2_01_FULL_42_12]|uniref:Uncharacterized protein n=1 Tax=Candidatus Yanofskybacteria bacterium RIFCSPLOWO2_01_FULL_42_49 TaxID=1802694 RepID=A0A1F8GAP2_9BACT|nr:MAG: hypothetical protein A2651_01480 [Candidatus Yanofskybacteria bacterium RIFCSPHIGHO2_01_FULL_42_12]OGN22100.1 MAG: hypothetical protein A2918_02980 [Candidatus Yanofskybacteria bacterium RIFCSPLOWO2_01_FULL_42_49]
MQIPGKVVNIWYSKNTKVVQVKIDLGLETSRGNRYIQGLFEFTDEYFGTLDPKHGDCVSVWAGLYKHGETVIYTNRNLTPGPTQCE